MYEAVDTSDIHQFPSTISKEPREPLVEDKHGALLDFSRKIRRATRQPTTTRATC